MGVLNHLHFTILPFNQVRWIFLCFDHLLIRWMFYMCLVSCSFREGVNDSLSDQPKLWAIWLEGSVLSWPMTSCYRSRLRTLESCVVISYRRTDYWSICNTRRSSISVSHNFSTCQLSKIILWLTACLNDCNIHLCLISMHTLLWANYIIRRH